MKFANLANILTMFRIVLAAFFFVLLSGNPDELIWQVNLAIIVFFLAGVTDLLDGYLARKYNITSEFGRVADPFADKVLICGAFVFLMPFASGLLNAWIVTVVIARELMVTTIRSFIEARRVAFGATWMGKLKMFLQSVVIVAILLSHNLLRGQAWLEKAFLPVSVYVMVSFTAISGLVYLTSFLGKVAEPSDSQL